MIVKERKAANGENGLTSRGMIVSCDCVERERRSGFLMLQWDLEELALYIGKRDDKRDYISKDAMRL